MSFHWDDLRVFLAVARAESLSGAGRILKMDPATVGRRVARLEADMGAVLFAKSPQGYDLTKEGGRLLEHAEAAEKAMTAGADVITDQDDTLRGTIRIGAPDGCANYILPEVCARIAGEHPDLKMQIVALPRVVNLSKREVDMAIGVSQPEAGRLTVQRITDYRLSLAAVRWYVRRKGPFETMDDLRGHKVVGYIPDLIFDKELDYLTEAGIQSVDFGSNSVAVQLGMIRAGAGIGIVHDFSLVHASRVQRILTDAFSLTRSFYLIRHADDRKVARLNRFAELLVTEVREAVARQEAAVT